jgi:SAM-dependent methyltransferase
VKSLKEVWHAQAAEWARFVRTPGHDRINELLNVPTLVTLLPEPPGRALDVGTGEGRFARELHRLGWTVVGADASPAMVELAGESVDAVVADAAALPFADGSFDLVTAFMSLQDLDEPDRAALETARVLRRGGHFCFCIPHPFETAGSFAERRADALFLVNDYLSERRLSVVLDRDGIAIDFAKTPHPIHAYSRMLESAGFVIESLREPKRPRELRRDETSARWERIPTFLHVRAVKA